LKKASKIIVALLTAVLLLSGCARDNRPAVYATVNGFEISRELFETHLALYRLQDSSHEFTKEEELRLLDQLIEEAVLLQEAGRRGIELDAEKAQKDFVSFRNSMISFLGSETAYLARLQEVQIAEPVIKRLIEEYQLINSLIKQEKEKAEDPTDEDIQDFYTKNKDKYFKHDEMRRIRHILINKSNFPDAAASEVEAKMEELIKDLHQRLAAGADFAALAKEYSKDTFSAVKGGELDFIEKVQLVPEFGATAWNLQVGQLSEPVRTIHGWHILEVLEIKPKGHLELTAQISDNIWNFILDERQQKRVDDLIKNLNDNAAIVRNFK
jgi:parvulin-like peptidyl-prolyl isomerase